MSDLQNDEEQNIGRENLAGGSGVFANFFEEMADKHTNSYLTQHLPNTTVFDRSAAQNLSFEVNSTEPGDNSAAMNAFFDVSENDDLKILDQFKNMKTCDRSSHQIYLEEDPDWATLARSSNSPRPGSSMRPVGPSHRPSHHIDNDDRYPCCLADDNGDGEICQHHEDDFCWLVDSHPPIGKRVKLLVGRFLLGETIGRGSYGKVKDAIDLVTLRRHAVKIISKLGVRKIPGGWQQALVEALVLRSLPPSRHIVSLTSVLRLTEPSDRLCLVMEHCLGSVHDLQAAGCPSPPDTLASDDFSHHAEQEDAEDEYHHQDEDIHRHHHLDRPRFKSHDHSRLVKESSSGNQDQASTEHQDEDDDQLGHLDRRHEAVSGPRGIRKRSNIEDARNPGDANRRRRRYQIDGQSSSTPPPQQQQFRRLSEAQAHAYFLQVINGLHFLHSHGVIHRDVKPGNLLLTPPPGSGLANQAYASADLEDGDCRRCHEDIVDRSIGQLLALSRGWLVKLADFGVSAILPAFQPDDKVGAGQITPAIQPPEVAKGLLNEFSGSRLDIYSTGVSLYFMLTGRVPFTCYNVLQIFEAIVKGNYVIPGHVSAEAADLVQRMMTKDPAKRITLRQIASHPWVVGNPPQPLSLSTCRSRLLARSASQQPSGSNHHLGQVTWLDPLTYLRRPSPLYPQPHIDGNGARIFNLEEFSDLDDDGEGEGGASYCRQGPVVVPTTVIDRLEVYHNLIDAGQSASRGGRHHQVGHPSGRYSPLLQPFDSNLLQHHHGHYMADPGISDLSNEIFAPQQPIDEDQFYHDSFLLPAYQEYYFDNANYYHRDDDEQTPPISPHDLPIIHPVVGGNRPSSSPSHSPLQLSSEFGNNRRVASFPPDQPDCQPSGSRPQLSWSRENKSRPQFELSSTTSDPATAPSISPVADVRARKSRLSNWLSNSISSLRNRLTRRPGLAATDSNLQEPQQRQQKSISLRRLPLMLISSFRRRNRRQSNNDGHDPPSVPPSSSPPPVVSTSLSDTRLYHDRQLTTNSDVGGPSSSSTNSNPVHSKRRRPTGMRRLFCTTRPT